MKIIANETLYARKCLEQGFIDKKKPYKSIRTVVRYLNQVQGMDNATEIYKVVKEYIDNTEQEVEYDIKIIRQMMNEESPYNELDYVYISKKELDLITNNNYPHSWKKILYSMLVTYKVKNAIFNVNNNRIDSEMSFIIRDARVTLGKEKREEMLAKFEEDGLIEMPNGGKQSKYFYLNYIDNEPEEIGIIVEDFDDFYLYFEQYVKGGRLINCSECGKLVLSQSKTCPEKYCKKCAKHIMYQQQIKYQQKQKG